MRSPTWTVVASLASLAGAQTSSAGSSTVAPGSVAVAASIGQTPADVLSEGDIRANARAFLFAGLDAQYVMVPKLAATLSGRIGGSFFDFNGSGTSGNVEEVLWSTRIGIDWIHEIGPK